METRIVAAEVKERTLLLFIRDESGELLTKEFPFAFWALATAEVPLPEGGKCVPLSGKNPLSVRVEFSGRTACEAAEKSWMKQPGVFRVRDELQQALSLTGERLFRQLDFHELKRMSLRVIPQPGAPDEIAAIEYSPAPGECCTLTRESCGSEESVLRRFTEAVRSCDPDVLEGFNLCREDLPRLTKRAKKLHVALECGRDGSAFTSRPSRFSAAEKQISYTRFSLFGRHVIDLLFLAILYDISHRDFDDFSLPGLLDYFQIRSGFFSEGIRRLGDIWEPAYFYRTGALPLGFQECILRGSGSALDALMIAEYQRRGASVPFPEAPRTFAGALTGMETPGVFPNVRHCDVRSLYPSILLMLRRSPARDGEGIFLTKLAELRRFRLEAKERARALPPGEEKERMEALQSSFKILINSFYGYLGFSQGSFNDYSLAETVTATGREILTKIMEQLRAAGAKVVEADTDGVYFCMPENFSGEFDEMIRRQLPEGIELDFDASYPAMYCYKAKNYALLREDGSILLSGAALKSRAMERFQRRYIADCLRAKLTGAPEKEENSYRALRTSLENRTIPLEELVKSEVLSDSPENYRKKQGKPGFRRSAAYEAALASGETYRAGDTVRFYVTGEKAKVSVSDNVRFFHGSAPAERDENTAYYLAKLEDLRKTFGTK